MMPLFLLSHLPNMTLKFTKEKFLWIQQCNHREGFIGALCHCRYNGQLRTIASSVLMNKGDIQRLLLLWTLFTQILLAQPICACYYSCYYTNTTYPHFTQTIIQKLKYTVHSEQTSFCAHTHSICLITGANYDYAKSQD